MLNVPAEGNNSEGWSSAQGFGMKWSMEVLLPLFCACKRGDEVDELCNQHKWTKLEMQKYLNNLTLENSNSAYFLLNHTDN